MNSSSATMVIFSSATPSNVALTVLRRVRFVCEPARRPKSYQKHHRMGRHSRARRLAPAIRPHLRLALHRSAPHRNRAAVPDHPRKRPAMHLGWARGISAADRAGSQRDVGGSAVARSARAWCHARRRLGAGSRGFVEFRARRRAARIRAHSYRPALPPRKALVAHTTFVVCAPFPQWLTMNNYPLAKVK
jgi:hypothetical protein